MEKVYDKAFKVGVAFNLVLMFALNLLSWAYSYYKFSNQPVIFMDAGGYSWGFPFEMYRNFSGYPYSDVGFTLKGVLLNTLFTMICGFVFGFYFRFINKKLIKR